MADPTSRAGTRYATEELLAYLERVHVAGDDALLRAFDAPRAEGMPQIQVGPSEGKLLSLLLRMVSAQKVVEVGTLAGYSAIHMARALGAGGKLWTIENDPKHHAVAQANIARAGLTDKVTCLLGSGLEVLEGLAPEGPFDAVFIDADKGNYDRYGRWAAQNIRPGGLLLGDNAYFFGNLLDDSPSAAAMRRFHEEARSAFDTVCMPTPDGLVLGLKR